MGSILTSAHPGRRRRAGYTLVEVLIAMVILGLVLPGLATMLVSSRKALTSNFRMDQAFSFGQLVLDSVAILPAGQVVAGTRTTSLSGTDYVASLAPSTAADGSIRLALTISWNQAGKVHQVRLGEVMRKDGLYR
ncbi:MAG: type II secretion system protein [Fibrobacteria bacterium]|nr:type II secretion system protein [Fibrobacteria bacterium]